MRNILALLSTAAALTCAATQAQAAPATYTISGTGSGSLNGTAFNNAAFTFTLTGDTAILSGNQIDPLTSATAAIAGFSTATFLIPTRLGVASNTTVYFSRSTASGLDLFDFNVATPVNLGVSFGPLTGTSVFALSQFQNVATSGGALTFNQSSSVQFAGQVGAVSPGVPEPGTWAMMLVGFASAGTALRRRQKLALRVRFA